MEIKAIIKPTTTIVGTAAPAKKVVGKLGFDVREIVRNRKQYEIAFKKELFEKDIRLMRLVIPKSTHRLGSNYAVRKIVRTDTGRDASVWVQFDMLVNGDFVLYSDDAFDGKIVLEEV